MCALAHWFEAAGLPTVLIALIREHAEAMRPPRALWVPFELGRPLGTPNDPAFQRRVLAAALALFDEEPAVPAGPGVPVLVDFPDEAPPAALPEGEEDDGLFCPVSFPSPEDARAPTLIEGVRDEIGRLQPWHDLALARGRRSTVGASGLEPAAIADFLDAVANEGAAAASPVDGLGVAQALKLAGDDLTAFYHEAAAARPDVRHTAEDALRWFWTETRAGALLLAVRDAGAASDDAALKTVATRLLVPRAAEAILAETTGAEKGGQGAGEQASGVASASRGG